MSLGVKLQGTATRLLTKFDERGDGEKLILRRPDSSPTYNATTREVENATTSDIEVTGVVVDYNEKQIDGVMILRGDRLAVVTSAVAPDQEDKLVDPGTGDIYAVIDVKTVRPTGVVIVYFVQVRK